MALPKRITLPPSNDALLRPGGLKDELVGVYFDDGATVTATLLDANGNHVAGCDGILMTHVTGSTTGDFIGVVDETFAPDLGTGYDLWVVADQGAAHGEWHFPTEIKTRP